MRYLFKMILFGPFLLSTLTPGLSYGYLQPIKSREEIEERRKHDELYSKPMLIVESIIEYAIRDCDRLPSKNEFQDFMSKAYHKDIKCSKPLVAWYLRSNFKEPKDISYFSNFLDRKEYEVQSDTKLISVSLKIDKENWKFKFFDPNKTETLVCKMGVSECFPSLEVLEINAVLEPERKETENLYLRPNLLLFDLLNAVLWNCDRLPLAEEFEELILKGSHKNIKCPGPLKNLLPSDTISLRANDFPLLEHYLNRKEHEVYSDKNRIIFLYRPNPKKWKYKHFKFSEHEEVIICQMGKKGCGLTSLITQISWCKERPEHARENCHLGNKKVIDYGTEMESPEYLRRKSILDPISKSRDDNYNHRFQHIDDQWNNELYRMPVYAVRALLEYSKEFCSRFPNEKEFKEFLLKGKHPKIRCTQGLENTKYKKELEDILGVNNPYFAQFIERGQFQVYTDKNKIAFISKPDFENKRFDTFRDRYDVLIKCSKDERCSYDRLENIIESCQNTPALCHFGGKKIVEYP